MRFISEMEKVARTIDRVSQLTAQNFLLGLRYSNGWIDKGRRVKKS